VAPDLVDDVPQLISSSLVGEEINGKRVLGAYGLPYPIGSDWPLGDAPASLIIIGARLSEMLLQEFQGLCPEVEPGPDFQLLHFSGGRRSNAMKPPDRQGLDETRPHFRGDDKEPVRLAVIGGKLREEFVV